MLREVLVATIFAPFTRVQSERLNRWQRDPQRTPLTCPEDGAVLVATSQWFCPRCNYKSNEAQDYMAAAPVVRKH
jgi:hypothetical protein